MGAFVRPSIQVKDDYPDVKLKNSDYAFMCKSQWDGCQVEFEDTWRAPQPHRCSPCNTEFMSWKRSRKWEKRLLEVFDYKRHRYFKFLTFGLEGTKTIADLIDYRAELCTRFNGVRRSKFWNEHVDGGMWFFEVTMKTKHYQDTVDGGAFVDDVAIHLNPHFHCLILGPKKIPIRNDSLPSTEVLEDIFENWGLGALNIRGDHGRDGPRAAVGYITAYLKKDNQAKGRNRGTWGIVRRSGPGALPEQNGGG